MDSRKDVPKKRPEDDFKEELVIKTGVISARDEVAARGPKVLGKIDLEPKKPAPKPEPKPEPVKEVVKPEPKPEVVVQTQTYDERRAADKSNVFRPQSDALTGPKVLGKIEVKDIDSGQRGKRKRITKDKVDGF